MAGRVDRVAFCTARVAAVLHPQRLDEHRPPRSFAELNPYERSEMGQRPVHVYEFHGAREHQMHLGRG
jgi:hypothetical protein